MTDRDGWQRLDARMLLVGPVRVLRQWAIPAVIALVGISAGDSGLTGELLPLLLLGAIVAGAVPWLTTYFRRTESQLQVRRGLLNKTLVTAPLDRVRSIDLESSLLHRMLGLSTVKIGTGVDETRIELDSLSRVDAERLRVELLHRSREAVTDVPSGEEGEQPRPVAGRPGGPDSVPPGQPAEVGETAASAGPPAYPRPVELARIDWSWLRFAPFSLSRLVILAGVLGGLAQFSEELPLAESAESLWQWVVAQALPLVLVGAAVLALLLWLVVSVSGYVMRWWDLRLVRDGGNLRLTAGLFTTRSTSVEEQRVRGVALLEPALLRLVGGAELATLATGVGAGGTTKVLPPSPVAVDRRVGAAVLGDAAPLTSPVVAHGPLARRRCHVRAQGWTVFGIAVGVLAVATPALGRGDIPVVVGVLLVVAVLAAGMGELAYRNLGHTLTAHHLVSTSGALQRNRTALERDGIIGWVVQQSFFQRRLGLATLVATTAAGGEKVLVEDVTLPVAVRLADLATPGLLDEFRAATG